jgi:predicted transcriptional regulator of viral defense system
MLRTIGPQTARLLDGLYDRSATTFTLADVQAITGLRSELATGLVNKAIHRGVFSRLKGGLYAIVPPELAGKFRIRGQPVAHS